jgi:hypothetical protein
MLTIRGRSRHCCNGLARRELLQIGGAGLFGLSLPQVWAAEAAMPARLPRANSVLFVFLYGGPSQVDTFDMKPDAASTIRGPFRPIASRTADLRICEHLPKLAARSHLFSVVRTMHHVTGPEFRNEHSSCSFLLAGAMELLQEAPLRCGQRFKLGVVA